jgi:Ca-activated chloride channel family protein
VEIDWGELGVQDVVPAEIPDVFVGQSVVVFGRFTGEPKGEIVLTGRRGKQRVRVPIAIDLAKAHDGDGLASTWARQRIGDITMDPAALVEDERARKARTEQVVALALAHRVMTEHTSFVAIDTVKSVDGEATTVPVPVEMPAGVEMDITGSMVGTEIGESYGVGGLGLVGTGRGGGGTGEGTVGLGSTGLIGKGSGGSGTGYGRGSAGATTVNGRVPRVRMAKATVAGSIDKDLVRRVVRSHVGEVRKCYEDGLGRDPNLKGRVVITFTIGKSGKVTASVVAESSVPDDAVGECIAKAALGWTFPDHPSESIVITYPFVLEPG